MKATVKIVYMRHPLNNIMSAAQRIGYYLDGAKVVGYKLLFPDGHTCCLTYAEIGERMQPECEPEAV
jgi:hypothetical protein